MKDKDIKEEEVKAEENKPAPEVKKEEDPNTMEKEKFAQQLSILNAELEKAKKETEDWKNKYYLAFADLSNTRKSLEKDHEVFLRYRSQGFLEKIIPTLDSFEMAAKSKVTNPEVAKYAEGYQMINRQLNQALADEGVTFIEPKINDKFDPMTMHAIQTVDGKEDNLIAAIYVKGYVLKDRLLRPAMVVVTKKKEEEAKKADEKKDSPKPEEEKK